MGSRNLIIFISLLIFDCHKEDVVQNSTITFTTVDSINSYWVVLSDKSGTVLDWKALVAKTPASLMFPQKEDSVNVTIIEKLSSFSSPTYEMTTYTNVVPGSYGVTEANETPVQNPNGNYILAVPDPSVFSSAFSVNSDCGWSSNSDGSQYNINVCAISSLYIWAWDYDNSAPRYLYIPQLTIGGTTVFDQTLYNGLPEMKSSLLTFSEYTAVAPIVTGVTVTGQNFFVSYFGDNSFANLHPIYYPDKVGSLFKKFDILLTYVHSNNFYVNYSFGKQMQVIPDLTIEDLSANLVAVSSNTISRLLCQLSGSAHYVQANFSTLAKSPSATSTGGWIVYSKFSEKVDITLPKLSSSLIKEIDFSFLANLELNEIDLIEDNDNGGYSNFYKASILGVVSQQLINFREKSYALKPDGSIGGREKNISPRLAKYKNYVRTKSN